MKNKYDVQLLVNVAKMYYLYGMKQEEIAKEIKVSRSSISLILTEAKERGVVEVNIRNPLANNTKLAKEFLKRFNLESCIIVPTSITNSEMLTQLVTQRACKIFDDKLENGMTVGIAWGRTCYEFMSQYQKSIDFDNIKIVPLIGGTTRTFKVFHINEMVRKYAEKINAIPNFIHAPAFPFSQEDSRLYMSSSEMKNIRSLWKTIDIALVSVGAKPSFYEYTTSEIITDGSIEEWEKKYNIVGDICARYIDINGNFIQDDITKRIIGISVDELRNISKVICMVAGIEKKDPILGALKTDLIDILITDEQTASAVVQEF